MLTIFTIPWGDDVAEHLLNRQENALRSWSLLEPRPEIILCAYESGVEAIAARWDAVHIPDVAYVEGRPSVRSAYDLAIERAGQDVLCFCTADVIFMQDFADAVQRIADRFERFMMIGRKWDVEIDERIKFDDGWQERLRQRVREFNKQHGRSAVDYHVFSKAHPIGVEMPDFVIGGTGWDTWLVDDTIRRGFDVVDASDAVTAVHQHIHGKRSSAACNRNRLLLAESLLRQDRDKTELTGKTTHAPWRMTKDGEIVENPHPPTPKNKDNR